MNESPSWAANQGDLERAARILRDSYSVNAVVAEDAEVPQQRTERRSGLSDFAQLFSPRYRARTLQALTISLSQTFGYNAVAYGLPITIAGLLSQVI